MKTIGLIGGMSWESTAVYYRLINRAVAARLGGFHSARLLLHSVDFHEIEELQRRGDWSRAGTQLAGVARALDRGGADFLVLCTNTMHVVADAITAAVPIPLLHIADPTADAVQGCGIRSVGLLGTRFTMEQDFYRRRLEDRGLTVITPVQADRELVHRVIYDELCGGEVRDTSRDAYRQVMTRLTDAGAEGIIFGCTEIGMLVGPDDSAVPTFDTTQLHADAAAEYAVQGSREK
ncbi:MAG: aspartate/glutamate racemase family protein [Acidiferrobacterales bacterium]